MHCKPKWLYQNGPLGVSRPGIWRYWTESILLSTYSHARRRCSVWKLFSIICKLWRCSIRPENVSDFDLPYLFNRHLHSLVDSFSILLAMYILSFRTLNRNCHKDRHGYAHRLVQNADWNYRVQDHSVDCRYSQTVSHLMDLGVNLCIVIASIMVW